jgi:hypothetical protein
MSAVGVPITVDRSKCASMFTDRVAPRLHLPWTMKNPETTAATTEETLATIEASTLDDVTGGCGACGQTCANGAAPVAPVANRVGVFNAFRAFARR